jgi:hypothetical protein
MATFNFVENMEETYVILLFQEQTDISYQLMDGTMD